MDGQVEYIKVPSADFNALKLTAGTEHEDFPLLADIFPTGWRGVEFSGFRPGESIAVFGAGPVGLMAAYSTTLRAASEVYAVDRVPETVGYQVTPGDGKTEKPNVVLEALIDVVRPTGGLGVPGLYVPSDPGSAAVRRGHTSFPFGKPFERVMRIGTGQFNVKVCLAEFLDLYNRYLRDLIISGKAKPSFVVLHQPLLDDTAMAYDKFDKRVGGFTKFLLHP